MTDTELSLRLKETAGAVEEALCDVLGSVHTGNTQGLYLH